MGVPLRSIMPDKRPQRGRPRISATSSWAKTQHTPCPAPSTILLLSQAQSCCPKRTHLVLKRDTPGLHRDESPMDFPRVTLGACCENSCLGSARPAHADCSKPPFIAACSFPAPSSP